MCVKSGRRDIWLRVAMVTRVAVVTGTEDSHVPTMRPGLSHELATWLDLDKNLDFLQVYRHCRTFWQDPTGPKLRLDVGAPKI